VAILHNAEVKRYGDSPVASQVVCWPPRRRRRARRG